MRVERLVCTVTVVVIAGCGSGSAATSPSSTVPSSVRACVRAAGASVAGKRSDIGFLLRDEAAGRTRTPRDSGSDRFTAVEIRELPPHRVPRYVAWVVRPRSNPERPIEDVVTHPEGGAFVAFLMAPSIKQISRVRTCV
jgi:hypothetical protein